MIQRNQTDVYKIHQQRREQLRTLKGDFKPSKNELDSAKASFFQKGGKITTLKVTSETRPSVWGDFVKSRIKAS
ncbi:MAG: hypothetical protein MJE63_13520 [Proteobacteria bacterium]|nr:hypothetical protein [Pseudomonadota bacterium]